MIENAPRPCWRCRCALSPRSTNGPALDRDRRRCQPRRPRRRLLLMLEVLVGVAAGLAGGASAWSSMTVVGLGQRRGGRARELDEPCRGFDAPGCRHRRDPGAPRTCGPQAGHVGIEAVDEDSRSLTHRSSAGLLLAMPGDLEAWEAGADFTTSVSTATTARWPRRRARPASSNWPAGS